MPGGTHLKARRPIPGWVADAAARAKSCGFKVSQTWGGDTWDLAHCDLWDPSEATPKPRQAITFFAVIPETAPDEWTFQRLSMWDGSETREPIARIENEEEARAALARWLIEIEAGPP